MNWTEQTESMMKMWNDAQKQFLGGWYNFAQGMPGLSGASAMPDLSNLMNWFKPGLMSGFPMGEGAGATSQAAAGNFMAAQAMMMQGFGMLSKAWQAVAPNIAAGKSWQPELDAFLKQWRDEVVDAPKRFSNTGASMQELMGSFLGEWGPLLKPWLASIQGTGLGGPMADMMMGGALPLEKMFGAGAEPAFRDLAQVPMMGVNREQIAKISRAFDSHVDLRKAAYGYQTAMGKAIGEAMKETIEKLVDLSKKDEKISSMRELMQIWVKITDKKLTQMYVTDEFTAVQAEMSKASLNNKLAQRAVLEMILKQIDIPTRTELDDAYKTLYDLKKAVRGLRSETVEVRSAHQRVEAEIMELRNARKQADSDMIEAREARRQAESDMLAFRDARKQAESDMQESRDGRKQAESEAEKFRDAARNLEGELASLRDTLGKMETRFAEDLAKFAASAKASQSADAKAPIKPTAPQSSPAGAGHDKDKEPIKVIKRIHVPNTR
uniref:Poly(3-hydroxyalkanoate) polymerase subunit PhaE n=1 Tax=Candidatus Kentrum sp. UNK TaxID=2126344 RepID=A0A451AIJ2_9GAMM|nr:MAG: poly(R)-hydroxyalkanoic acid synthase, class III, PhaE subunit [Candidatus Kentron sp. UNK]VFK69627.1 MAG: poly(R)-hydroxyalkanoic acid synthase, class III, PhaE subunit [Candidatus Kentron sp. UNK]